MARATDVNRHIGGKRKPGEIDRLISKLAARQHGVVSRAQLLAAGVRPDAIDFRVQRHRLHPLYRAVYVTGSGPLSRETRWTAAVLAGGQGATLSHASAAALWGLPLEQHRIDVTAPTQRRSRSGVRFHCCELPADERTTRDGIAVTSVPRTLFDLAADLRPRRLERMLNAAEVLRLWDELSLHDLLHRYPARPGTRAIRALLAAHDRGATVTRSELEVRFLEFLDEARLPAPETNVVIEGFEVDCLWRGQRLAVELDGRDFHFTEQAFERDRERDRLLQVAGWRAVRVTWHQLHGSPECVADDLRRLLRAPTGSRVSGPTGRPASEPARRHVPATTLTP